MTENATNYSIPNNYVESATGENLINVTTGEVRKAIPAKIPDGGRVQTPEELADFKRLRPKRLHGYSFYSPIWNLTEKDSCTKRQERINTHARSSAKI